jgi:myosin-5
MQGQLFQLMQRLESTTPHFIRCIKPNNLQSPESYEQGLVLQQLRCCGVLEVVRISRSGFPTRMSHQKFSRRYITGSNSWYIYFRLLPQPIPHPLFPGFCLFLTFFLLDWVWWIRYGFLLFDNAASQDPLGVSVSILHQFNILPEMYQVGYTKLFFRTGQVIFYIMKIMIQDFFFPDFLKHSAELFTYIIPQ